VVAPPLVVIGNDDDDDGVDGDDCLGLVMMGSVVASSWDVMQWIGEAVAPPPLPIENTAALDADIIDEEDGGTTNGGSIDDGIDVDVTI